VTSPSGSVILRRIPYPYAAALSICSDLDETPDDRVFFDTARYLNTHEATPMGPGLGLEVGNSIYFDMAPDRFSYWNSDETARAFVRAMIRSGHVDCIHSFGDRADTRAHAKRALEELARHGCGLEVWVDHSVAPSNFGTDIMRGQGDDPGSRVYHADLSRAFGIRYVWRGRVTSVIGQDRSARLGGLFRWGHPWTSARTVAKELAKQLLARVGGRKYSMHGRNRVYRATRLRDGGVVFEFLRCNPHWAGVSRGDTADGLGEVLTEGFLRTLVEREGVCVLCTHLGKVRSRREPLPPSSCEALGRVALASRDGRLLVASTRRILRYLTVRDYLRYRVEDHPARRTIRLSSVEDPITGPRRPTLEELQGVTFVTPQREVVLLLEDGTTVPSRLVRVGAVTYAGVPWRSLEFPALSSPGAA
jgi:hypothetical protein